MVTATVGGVIMGTRATSEAAEPASSSADTIAFVIGQHLIRDCVGAQLAGRLPGFNVRLIERPEDLVELGDWCSIALVVLWLNSSDMDFEAAFATALEAAPTHPIAILSDFADSALVSRALSHGVRGYLSPSMSLTEIACAIRFVVEGGTFVPLSVLNGMTAERPASPKGNSGDDRFSPRQLEVLELLQQGKQNKIIAYELGMAEATVKVHVRMIMKKLNARNRTEAVLKTKRAPSASRTIASEAPALLPQSRIVRAA
jgi:DNA-binding NarL/FixJ family response regulator